MKKILQEDAVRISGNFSKSGFDRAVNILVGTFATLFSIVLFWFAWTSSFLSGFGASTLSPLLLYVLAATSLSGGIYFFKKKVELENALSGVNFLRAFFLALTLLIILLFLFKDVSF